MALNPAVLEVTPSRSSLARCAPMRRAADYWALTKPEINFLIAIATFAGFYLGLPTTASRLPVHAADSHSARYAAGIERREHAKPVC